MAWRVARSLDKLLAQINAYAPNRSKISDGSIGDASHSSRVSDHNPDSRGIVHARDFTHSPTRGFDAHAFVRRLAKAGDRRIKYLISNRQISNPSIGAGRWRPYSGINPHTQHAHVSVVYSSLEDNTANWPGLGATASTVTTAPTEPKGVLGMVKHINYTDSRVQIVQPNGNYKTLRVDKKSEVSRIVTGPAQFSATSTITFSNLQPGYSAWVRIIRGGYKKGQKLAVGRTISMEEFLGSTGETTCALPLTGAINKDYGSGRQTRVYLLVRTNNPEPLQVKNVHVEGLRN